MAVFAYFSNHHFNLFCLVKWAKTNAFVFPIGKMKLINMLNLFQPIEFSLSKFDSLDPTYQTSKARIRQVGKDSAFLLASSCLSPKAFVLAQFTRQNTLFFSKKRKTLKINAPNSFFQNEPKFFYIILDFFNKCLSMRFDNLAKKARRLKFKIELLEE